MFIMSGAGLVYIFCLVRLIYIYVQLAIGVFKRILIR